MTRNELAGKIDLTLLRPTATADEFQAFIKTAPAYPFASVCIPPTYVETASNLLKDTSIKVATVIGFPLGYTTCATKVAEAKQAMKNGADELDMVMNISAFKSGNTDLIKKEIFAVVSAAPGLTVKVIIECCYLTDVEKIEATNLIIKSGAHFVKTSTGFGPSGATGATVKDVRLLKKTAGSAIRVKAAGGIKTLDHALAMIEAGADRLGLSSGLQIVEHVK